MDENEIRRIAGRENIPVGILEKDYILSVMLIHLKDIGILEHLVFKGGTAIKKIYYPETRFSEDLDFNYYDINRENIFQQIKNDLKHNIEETDVEFIDTKDLNYSNTGLTFRIGYMGPLKHKNSIKLDFSGREELIEPKNESEILHDYPDLKNKGRIKIPSMSISGILAEKCRALMMRAESKDLFDLWFLTKRGVSFDLDLVKRKHEGYEEEWSKEKYLNRLKKLENTWKRDLESFLDQVPKYETVEEELNEVLNF